MLICRGCPPRVATCDKMGCMKKRKAFCDWAFAGDGSRLTSRRAFLAGAAAATAGYRMSGTEADRYSAAKALSGVKPTVAVAEIPFSTKPI